MGSGVTTEVRDERTVAVKRATSGDDIERVEREAAVLAAADHPGVVSLLALERSPGEVVLVTDLAGTRTLEAAGDDAANVLAVLAAIAAVAATVADLHELGIVHGRLEASHVVLAADGRPVLCGFADAGFVADGADPAVDVVALGALLLDALEGTGDPALARRIRPVAERAATGLASARSIAAALPPALSPGPDDGRDPLALLRRGVRAAGASGRDLRRPAVAAAAVAATAVAVLVGVALTVSARDAGRPAAAPPPPPSTTSSTATTAARPPVERVWPPPAAEPNVVEIDGVRYEVGEPGDEVAVGDWDCDGAATPAVLRPSTGAVFVFGGWDDATVEPVARVPGGRDIRTADPDGDGCADVVVDTADGSEAVA